MSRGIIFEHSIEWNYFTRFQQTRQAAFVTLHVMIHQKMKISNFKSERWIKFNMKANSSTETNPFTMSLIQWRMA